MKLTLFVLGMLLCLSVVPCVFASTTTEILYMRGDSHTVNGVAGYIANTTQDSTAKTTSLTGAGDVSVFCGWRVWVSHSDNTTTEMTSGTPVGVVSRTALGGNASGMQTQPWISNVTSLYVGYDALVFRVYIKVGGGDYTQRAVFTTTRLLYSAVQNTTWNFALWTAREYGPTTGITVCTIGWGNATYQTRVGNGVVFTDPTVYEQIQYAYSSGNFITGITLPYTNLVGNLFYGLMLLVVCVPLYNRYESVDAVLVVMVLFGGVGGFTTLLIPEAGLTFTWLVLTLGIAGLLYSVFR